MKIAKNIKAFTAIAVLVILTVSMIILLPDSGIMTARAQTQTQTALLQYEWSQYMGNENSQRYQANGPAPSTGDVEWTTTIGMPGVLTLNNAVPTAQPGDAWVGEQAMITAFNGLVYVPLQRSLYALDPFTGTVVWRIDAPNWTTPTKTYYGDWTTRGNGVYKINNNQLLAINNINAQLDFCLIDSANGSLDGKVNQSCLFPGARANVYVPDYNIWVGYTGSQTGLNGFVSAFNFTDLSKPPVLLWNVFGEGWEATLWRSLW